MGSRVPDPLDREPDEHRFRGAFMLPPAALRPPPTRLQRVAAYLKRVRVLVAATIAAMLAVVGLLNASLDLWGRSRPEPEPTGSVQAGFQTGIPGLEDRAL